jgi:hypothetical protein
MTDQVVDDGGGTALKPFPNNIWMWVSILSGTLIPVVIWIFFALHHYNPKSQFDNFVSNLYMISIIFAPGAPIIVLITYLVVVNVANARGYSVRSNVKTIAMLSLAQVGVVFATLIMAFIMFGMLISKISAI